MRTIVPLFILFILAGLLPTLAPAHAQQRTVLSLLWEDVDCNGLRDPAEPGIAAVQVALLQQGNDRLVYTADDRLLEYTIGNMGTAEYPRGHLQFTRGLPGLPEDYYLAIFNADQPAGYRPAPFRSGNDPALDNDLTMPLAGSPLWATAPFRLDPAGPVTEIALGLCREHRPPAIDDEQRLFAPLITQ